LKGRRQFHAAIKSAESIADCAESSDDWLLGAGVLSCEELLDHVYSAMEQLSGHQLPSIPVHAFGELRGIAWSEDELPNRFPRLWECVSQTMSNLFFGTA